MIGWTSAVFHWSELRFSSLLVHFRHHLDFWSWKFRNGRPYLVLTPTTHPLDHRSTLSISTAAASCQLASKFHYSDTPSDCCCCKQIAITAYLLAHKSALNGIMNHSMVVHPDFLMNSVRPGGLPVERFVTLPPLPSVEKEIFSTTQQLVLIWDKQRLINILIWGSNILIQHLHNI